MARLPRLALAGHAHWLLQRGLSGRPVFHDDADRDAYLAALREAAATAGVRLHAFALADDAVHLVVTPAEDQGPSRLMQALGRRYVSAHHRRHGGSGTLWDGRFRCAVVEAGAPLLAVLLLVDGLAPAPGHSSAGHRSGHPERRVLLVDPPEVWTLGNTPFERESAWQQRLADGLPAAQRQSLLGAVAGNWAIGSTAFARALAEKASRPTRPRPRGRPAARRTVA
ncbi:MAG: transposase [Rubrivivax sp.]